MSEMGGVGKKRTKPLGGLGNKSREDAESGNDSLSHVYKENIHLIFHSIPRTYLQAAYLKKLIIIIIIIINYFYYYREKWSFLN